MRDFFKKLRSGFLDALFPAYCLGCKEEGSFLCQQCQKSIATLDTPGLIQAAEGSFLDGLLAMSRFEDHGLLQKCIHQLKYDFIEDLSEPLGRLLFDAFRLLPEREPRQKFLLCPLPLHPRRSLWRGFNQAEKLCSVIADESARAGMENVGMFQPIERTSFSRPQMELGRQERIANVAGAFVLRDGFDTLRLGDCTVVIVDDIATTLSTMNAAAEPLKKAGAVRVYGLVLARVF